MRISELSARTEVAVGTIKYYLREGLVPPGRQTSRTSAVYDDAHVERIRLVRALVESGGLGIAAVKRVIAVIDGPEPDRLDVLATAQQALLGEAPPPECTDTPECTDLPECTDPPPPDRAAAWLAARGWFAPPGDPLTALLEEAWRACDRAGLRIDDAMVDAYADGMEQIARVDVAAVPPGVEDAARRVVVGTVMIEPMLSALRLLAQRQESLRLFDGEAGEQELRASGTGSGTSSRRATRG